MWLLNSCGVFVCFFLRKKKRKKRPWLAAASNKLLISGLCQILYLKIVRSAAFEKTPSCLIEMPQYMQKNKQEYYISPAIDVFHLLIAESDLGLKPLSTEFEDVKGFLLTPLFSGNVLIKTRISIS